MMHRRRQGAFDASHHDCDLSIGTGDASDLAGSYGKTWMT